MIKYKSCTEYWLDTKKYRFRGEFEQMYRDIGDPWGCQANSQSLNNRLFGEILFEGRKYKRILDIGCGLGGLTDYLHKRNGGGEIIGCDISPTAVEKARSSYPHISFRYLNILTDRIKGLGAFDLVILSEMLWYILEGLKAVFTKIEMALAPDGICGVHQFFPFEQRYGKEIIDGLEGFAEFLSHQTSLITDRKVLSYVDDGIVLLASLKQGE